MPSKNFHVCDIDTSLKVVGSARKKSNGKNYTIRYGVPKGGGGSRIYAIYYPVTEWTSAQARAHCKKIRGNLNWQFRKCRINLTRIF